MGVSSGAALDSFPNVPFKNPVSEPTSLRLFISAKLDVELIVPPKNPIYFIHRKRQADVSKGWKNFSIFSCSLASTSRPPTVPPRLLEYSTCMKESCSDATQYSALAAAKSLHCCAPRKSDEKQTKRQSNFHRGRKNFACFV